MADSSGYSIEDEVLVLLSQAWEPCPQWGSRVKTLDTARVTGAWPHDPKSFS